MVVVLFRSSFFGSFESTHIIIFPLLFSTHMSFSPPPSQIITTTMICSVPHWARKKVVMQRKQTPASPFRWHHIHSLSRDQSANSTWKKLQRMCCIGQEGRDECCSVIQIDTDKITDSSPFTKHVNNHPNARTSHTEVISRQSITLFILSM